MSNKNVVENLKAVLADSYVLSLKTQNYHWNVTSPNFSSLHGLFEEQYTEIVAAIDEIAERIRALGEKAPGSFREFSALASISEASGDNISAADMVKQLANDQESLLKTIHKALDVAQNAEDDVTADMLIARIQVHDKNKWMLESSI